MGAGNEKPVGHQPPNTEPAVVGGSRLRRKLSYGLSFISSPLSQRKIAPCRQSSGRQALSSSNAAFHYEPGAKSGSSGRLLASKPTSACSSIDSSPVRISSTTTSTMDNAKPKQTSDPDATPKPLPRSQTMSYIPLPTRSSSETSSTDVLFTVPANSPRLVVDAMTRKTPSKIPTPSPPPDGNRRLYSPRQYRQDKHIGAGAAFAATTAATATQSSKTTFRSHTTPNLRNRKTAGDGALAFMIPKGPAMRYKPTTSPPEAQRGLPLKENTPTTQSARRLSQFSTTNSRPTSLVSQTTASNRRSVGPVPGLAQSKQSVVTTPLTTQGRLGTHLSVQTPATAKRNPLNKRSNRPSPLGQDANVTPISQPRLMGPLSAPTPTPPRPTGLRPPGLSAEKVQTRRAVRTPTRMNSPMMPAKYKRLLNNEVRPPRSSTFHYMPRHLETPPPIPAIPEMYRTRANRQEIGRGGEQLSASQAGSPLARCAHFKPILSSTKEAESEDVLECYHSSPTGAAIADSSDDETITALPGRFTPRFPKDARSFSASEEDEYIHIYANAETRFQVKEPMPAAWWAGRFQTRYDQWRCEAMKSELNPSYKPTGAVGGCRLPHERDAACHILLQLRELCTTSEALDSLREFEYNYRRARQLLHNMPEYPRLPSAKQNDTATPRQGPFGRAVRKLTPRKSSLVNLLKGKGWNRAEDTRHGWGNNEKDTSTTIGHEKSLI